MYAYSAERSPLPVYGNVVSFLNQNQRPRPRFNVFQDFMATTTEPIRNVRRDFHRNRFVYNPSLYNHPGPLLPFITSDSLTVQLLASITERDVRLNQAPLPAGHQVLRHGDLQRVWKDILQESDNFLAEQLLLMVADALFGELDDEKAIAAITKTFLWDLPDAPKWVDGSGLSRHNLVTPRSMIALLQKIEEQMPRRQVLELLPKGGVSGTLKFNYAGPRPYVIGKTGTVSNHHSLVGYIRTNQDRYLMFAFMHNNYMVKASEVRREMEKVLRFIRDNY
ncbi:D-alanyl-D-alanine carboxypeptidase [Nitritalea halalkaliphila]|uniref:D-alanyl-D-alanine carboxypeptidase n=1 Tax=Nitritalea halalkaliphila TaxID=590849 RepID=UPI001EE65065|nr:D-alanyl-D-alanine carboxypeptidase [Nitritalea halalkaliphila]